ncbi:hypothetical protein D3875_01245 [Deinococcus cavernae]|uniref:Uncharacterized protein n=1 Tax=Deinococcus cavernae TaxID=2320857 RepID=A0A418VHS9_9DEIO|nr:hypothetical protein [Deinococcus cavernae]RJF75701.1 hypothetical protein D3875_01245 [Deinococcus cavernae]
MNTDHDQLRRVLQLALNSPYEGERRKAVALLLQRMERECISLSDLDPSFCRSDTANTLRHRARLPYEFEVTLKSHEEAQLYEGLLKRHGDTAVSWLEGHRLLCVASPEVKAEVEGILQATVDSLRKRLAAAQQQAMGEYQQRRKVLFAQAVADEIRSLSPDNLPAGQSASPSVFRDV